MRSLQNHLYLTPELGNEEWNVARMGGMHGGLGCSPVRWPSFSMSDTTASLSFKREHASHGKRMHVSSEGSFLQPL